MLETQLEKNQKVVKNRIVTMLEQNGYTVAQTTISDYNYAIVGLFNGDVKIVYRIDYNDLIITDYNNDKMQRDCITLIHPRDISEIMADVFDHYKRR